MSCFGDQTGHSNNSLLADLAARQWGIVDDQDCRSCGLSAKAVRTRVRASHLHPVFRGVYALGHSALSLTALFFAATKAAKGVLSHWSAAVLWGLLTWHDDLLPEVTVTSSHGRKIDGLTVHRTRRPFKVVRFDGIPVTTPARALEDIAPSTSYEVLRRAARQAMVLKRVTLKELTGSAALRHLVADGYVPTRSELEDVFLDLLERAGIARPEVNRTILVGGVPTEPDFRWPAQRLVVETDGAQYHGNPLSRADDAAKQARLEASGDRVIRVTWRQAVDAPAQTIQRLRTAGAPASVP